MRLLTAPRRDGRRRRVGALVAAAAMLALLAAVLPAGPRALHTAALGSGTWSPTGSMASPGRFGQTATLLRDGRVLVTGGFAPTAGAAGPTASRTAELYDPATGAWTSVHPMLSPRGGHTATLLADGKVLIAGGLSVFGSSCTFSEAITEIFDPATNVFTAGPLLPRGAPLAYQTATTLQDGRVALIGGITLKCLSAGVYCDGPAGDSSVLVYDPVAGTITSDARVCMPTPRSRHSAFLQSDGTVLVAGGENDNGNGPKVVGTTEVWDPSTGGWSTRGSLTVPRTRHVGAAIGGGAFLVAGGLTATGITATSEVYDPLAKTWSAAGAMTVARAEAPVATLGDGALLVSGGYTENPNPATLLLVRPRLATAELFDPVMRRWTPTGTMGTARQLHTLTTLADGRRALAAGGTPDEAASLPSAELYAYLPPPPTPPPPTPTPTPCAGSPALRLSPVVVPLGYTTVVTGTGFCPGPVTVTWAPAPGRTMLSVGIAGTFSVSLLVFPRDIIGQRTVVATGAGGATASAVLLVVAPPAEPPSVNKAPFLVLRG